MLNKRYFDIGNAIEAIIKPKEVKPIVMLPEEWSALFIHWLVKDRYYGVGFQKKHSEITPAQLNKEVVRFHNKWRSELRNIEMPTASEILDATITLGWIVPSAGDTLQINPKNRELKERYGAS